MVLWATPASIWNTKVLKNHFSLCLFVFFVCFILQCCNCDYNYLQFLSALFVVDWQQNCVRHVLIQAIWWMALEWVLTTSWVPWWHFIARLATCFRATPRWNVSWAAAGDPSGTEPNQAVKVRGNSATLREAPASQTSTLQLFGHYWIPGYNSTLLR